ncbi:MAG: LysO family transporter [Candidatus Bathyarchaeia archaeon]
MSDQLTALYLMIPLVAGIVAGYVLRNRKQLKLAKASVPIVLVLIFCIGFGIGSSNELLAAMPTVGLQALVICVLAVSFSIAFVLIGRRLMKAE